MIVVQSTGRERAEALNRAGGRYHVAIQGYRRGEVVEETEKSDSIRHALHADSEWDAVLGISREPALIAILSNTTEAGLALDEADRTPPDRGAAPRAFPAKLLLVLRERWLARLPGLWILPCELIESNGDRLLALVTEQAARWAMPGAFLAWLRGECRWVNSLVDRIVPGPPTSHPLLGVDPLLVSAEPYALWAIELTAGERERFPLRHPALEIAPDISPHTLRKVRLLNGAHSALVCRAMNSGVETVRECVEHPEIGPWLEELLFEEIAPTLEDRCHDPAAFASEVLDRFRNPFLKHRLGSIALNHEAKIAVRLRPTLDEYRARFGKRPARLSRLLGGAG